ncbi:alpha/beta fold hydrolase [Allorhizocola rhizosphaerae]|uniref:alpha/beta fold hydrolase n=1 Tax=Allorhizocola rhizosphaerae TaxID=1872709 RepID=UPI000E3E38D5|nr:alpha/beta hydrolase [Allorhizocola rhizosphaerae]
MLVSARGFEFAVHVDGPEDGPAVVLLHGFPQHSGQWHLVTPLLHAEGLRTIAIDQRGYSPGARPEDPAQYAIDEMIADTLSIMDELGVGRFHVVGHDWGAAVAWGLAGDHPDRVLSLTAISVPHPAALMMALADKNSDQAKRSTYVAFFAQLDESVPAMLANDGEMFKMIFQGSGLSDEQLERYVGPMRDPAALRAGLSWYTAIVTQPPKNHAVVTVPTTYIWSDQDMALGGDAARACARFVSGDYRFVELKGISHWVPDQAPEAVAEAIVARVR